MRPRYHTTGIVLGRTPLGEASALLSILTPDFGLVKARAQGVRKTGAKLSAPLQSLSQADIILVRGKDGWRLSGAQTYRAWSRELASQERARAGRVARLLLRLVGGESKDFELFETFSAFLETLKAKREAGDVAECLAALSVLRTLGFDAGEFPVENIFTDEALAFAAKEQPALILRINRGIKASGL